MSNKTLQEIIDSVKTRRKTGPIPGTDYFFKAKSNGVTRADHKLSIEEEYACLARMYELIPENAPKPIALIRNEKGAATGYIMERIYGKPLSSYFSLPDETKKELATVLKTLAEKGFVHGDIRSKNIMVSNKHIKLIDPAGIRGSDPYRLKNDTMWGRFVLDSFPSETEIASDNGPYKIMEGVTNRLLYFTGVAESVITVLSKTYRNSQ